MTHHRHTVKVPLRPIDYPILTRVQTDPNLKVMVFCAAEGGGRQDIAFPHQSEIKVNGGEVKANLRGLKNKPGSTRPVDITKELRLNIPAYSNNVEMTYALTSKVGDRSEVSFLKPHVFITIPNCLSPFAPHFALTTDSVYRNFISSSMWYGVYLSPIL
jgi:PINIT domain